MNDVGIPFTVANIGSVRGSPNGSIGSCTNGTIGLPMEPLAYQGYHLAKGTMRRANCTFAITIGTNGITDGNIGRTLNDVGIPLVQFVEP